VHVLGRIGRGKKVRGPKGGTRSPTGGIIRAVSHKGWGGGESGRKVGRREVRDGGGRHGRSHKGGTGGTRRAVEALGRRKKAKFDEQWRNGLGAAIIDGRGGVSNGTGRDRGLKTGGGATGNKKGVERLAGW